MIGNIRQHNYEEKLPNNSLEVLEQKNMQKISIRKNKNYLEIKKKRFFNLDHSKVDLDSNIKPEQKFKINKFEQSYQIIFSYLNSNDNDLIKYCIDELRVYFIYNEPNPNEQKIIIDNNLFNILLNLGKKYLINNDLIYIQKILWILINIQVHEKGSSEYYNILYSKSFFDFYNDCLKSAMNEEVFNLIRWIIESLFSFDDIDENMNLILLRSDVFISLLDFFDNQNLIRVEDKELTLKIILYAIDLDYSKDFLDDNDKKRIDRCLSILITELIGTSNEILLSLIIKGIYYISQLDDKFGFNKRIINEGVSSKLLKFLFTSINLDEYCLKIINYSLKILVNNLSLPDEECKLINNSQIIDYYNNVLMILNDNFEIVFNVLCGLKNIAISNNKNIIKLSKIWEEKYIQKLCGFKDEIKNLLLKIIKYFILDKDYEKLKFIYDTKILQYFIFLFTTTNISQKICVQIIKVIDIYLKKFNNEFKETKEYLIIYHKFCDLFHSSEKINTLNNLELITVVAKNIQNNYN
jgi:hypothetical protein